MTKYEDPTLKAIIKMLNEKGPERLKNRYSIGDPIVVAQKALPRVFLQYDSISKGRFNMEADRKQKSVLLNVVLDIKKNVNQDVTDVLDFNSLVEWIAGENADFSLKDDTIMKLITTEDMSGIIIDPAIPVEVDFGVGVERRGAGIMTAEAIVRFQVLQIEKK